MMTMLKSIVTELLDDWRLPAFASSKRLLTAVADIDTYCEATFAEAARVVFTALSAVVSVANDAALDIDR
jgi:hypothetical protein